MLAAHILSDMRDSFEVDHEHVLATELNMSLDERFRPTRVADAIAGTCLDSKDEPVVVGTLDALYSFPEEGMMRIDDFVAKTMKMSASTPARLKTAPIEQAEEGEVVDAVPKEK